MTDAATGWTDDRVELLAKLWAEGLSASQIAAALGGGVTRNAVIGKVHRLGLSGRAKAGAPATPRPAKAKPASQTPPAVDAVRPVPREFEPAARLPAGVDNRWSEDPSIPETQRVSIVDLRESMCRWPIGDPQKPEFGFCGARSVTGMPYCGHHCRVAYQPVTERRRLRA